MQLGPTDVETVKVVAPVVTGNPHGYVVINKTELTTEHRLHGEAAPSVPEPVAPRRKKA